MRKGKVVIRRFLTKIREEVLEFVFRQAELKALLDQYKDAFRLKLIVCGSSVDTMRSLLLVQNLLYGRVDLTIDLKHKDVVTFYCEGPSYLLS